MTMRDLVLRHGVPAWLRLRQVPGLGGVLPDFVIIGAQKAGTTSLYNLLARHRDVRRCLGQEVHYFDRHHDRGLAWYRAHFGLPLGLAGHLRTGESTPYYLFHPRVAERAAAVLPQTRFIALLREPRARAISAYHHERSKGREPLAMIEAFRAEQGRLAPEIARLEREPGYDSAIHRHHGYVARSRYAEQLERWFAAVGRERVLVLKSEAMYAGDPEIVARLATFLDLDLAGFGALRRHNAGSYEAATPEALGFLEDALADSEAALVRLLGPQFDWTPERCAG